MGLGFIVIAICPTGPGGSAGSTTAIIHVAAAVMVACLFPPSAYCIWKSNDRGPGDSNLGSLTLITIICGVVLSIATAAGLFFNTPWKGAVERVMSLNGLVWFQAVGYHVAKHHPALHDRENGVRTRWGRLTTGLTMDTRFNLFSQALPVLARHGHFLKRRD
jgi:hypothetical protein